MQDETAEGADGAALRLPNESWSSTSDPVPALVTEGVLYTTERPVDSFHTQEEQAGYVEIMQL